MQDFLGNKGGVQDRQFLEYTERNRASLARMGVLRSGMSESEQAGLLVAAHLKGPGGAKAMAQGRDNADANGTKASSYFKMMAGIGSGASAGAGADQRPVSLSAADEACAAGLHVTSSFRGKNHPLTRRNPNSAHSQGRAWDLRARTPEQADAAMAKQRELLTARGLVEGKDFKFRDEVRNPVGRATGPHVHAQLTEEGAARYGQSMAQKASPQLAARSGLTMPPSAALGRIAGDRNTSIRGGNTSTYSPKTSININNPRGEVVPQLVAKAVNKQYESDSRRATDVALQPPAMEDPAPRMLGGASPFGAGGGAAP